MQNKQVRTLAVREVSALVVPGAGAAAVIFGDRPEVRALVCPSGLVVMCVEGRAIGSWRPTRWLRRLVPYMLSTPAWTKEYAERAREAERRVRLTAARAEVAA
jgi:hypothetical protein